MYVIDVNKVMGIGATAFGAHMVNQGQHDGTRAQTKSQSTCIITYKYHFIVF